MTPLEHIENGITNNNWKAVCDGYKQLTGKALPVPVNQSGDIEHIYGVLRQIVSAASNVLPAPETIVHTFVVDPEPKKRGRKKKRAVTKDGEDQSIQINDKNQFITNDPDPEEIKANKIKAEKAKPNKLKLARTSPKKYTVTCNECDKEFESDRPDGEMGQKCRRCLNDKKSRFV